MTSARFSGRPTICCRAANDNDQSCSSACPNLSRLQSYRLDAFAVEIRRPPSQCVRQDYRAVAGTDQLHLVKFAFVIKFGAELLDAPPSAKILQPDTQPGEFLRSRRIADGKFLQQPDRTQRETVAEILLLAVAE